MPLSITLSDGTVTATLTDGTNFDIHYGGLKLGQPSRNRVYAQPWQRGFSPLAGQTVYNRDCEIQLFIRGTSLDNWNANYRSIAGVLKGTADYWASNGQRGTACTLSIQLNGQTNATTFDVLAGEIDASDVGQPTMTITGGPWLSTAVLKLTLKPYGRPTSPLTATSATLTNGGGTSGGGTTAMSHLFTPSGDQDAPAKLQLTFTEAASGNTPHRVVVGRKSRGNTSNFIAVFHGEATTSTTGVQSTYPGYAVYVGHSTLGGIDRVADTSQENGAFTRFRSPGNGATVLMSWSIDSASDFAGSYRVFAKSSTNSNASVFPVSVLWGGDSATWLASNAPVAWGSSAGSPAVIDLGTITLPLSGPASASGPIWLHLWGSATGRTSADFFGLDCIYLIPSDEAFVDVRVNNSNINAGANQVVIDDTVPRPEQYALTSASAHKTSAPMVPTLRTPLTLAAGRQNLWVGLAFGLTGASPTSMGLGRTYTMNFSYYPQYDQFAT